jgi:hypothetical protein
LDLDLHQNGLDLQQCCKKTVAASYQHAQCEEGFMILVLLSSALEIKPGRGKEHPIHPILRKIDAASLGAKRISKVIIVSNKGHHEHHRYQAMKANITDNKH